MGVARHPEEVNLGLVSKLPPVPGLALTAGGIPVDLTGEIWRIPHSPVVHSVLPRMVTLDFARLRQPDRPLSAQPADSAVHMLKLFFAYHIGTTRPAFLAHHYAAVERFLSSGATRPNTGAQSSPRMFEFAALTEAALEAFLNSPRPRRATIVDGFRICAIYSWAAHYGLPGFYRARGVALRSVVKQVMEEYSPRAKDRRQ